MTGLAGACAAMMRSTVADCSHAVRTRRATASSGTNAMTDGPEPETNDRDAPAARATSMASPLRGCKLQMVVVAVSRAQLVEGRVDIRRAQLRTVRSHQQLAGESTVSQRLNAR